MSMNDWWSEIWEMPSCLKSMSRDRFNELIKYKRFDIRVERFDSFIGSFVLFYSFKRIFINLTVFLKETNWEKLFITKGSKDPSHL